MARLPRRQLLAYFAWVFATASVGWPRDLLAQATTISLQGVVSATDGSIPSAVQIEVLSRTTGAVRRAVGDPRGGYRVLGLAPGVYHVSVRAVGYRQERREDVQLVVGQRATLNFTLEPGAVELEPVVIAGEPPSVVQRIDVSTPVLQEEIERLPLNSRNVLNLAAVAPGIRTYAVEAGRSVPAAGSLPATEPRFTNFYVDGVEWKNMYVGQPAGVPATGSLIPQEAVREFRVYLNPYDPEYTRGAAYVISAVTHQGGNDTEGSVFAYLQNRSLVQQGFYQAEKPDYGRYQFGGNLRGPIVRDRLFYSLSYEGQLTDNYIDVVLPLTEKPSMWEGYAGTFRAPHRLHTGLLRLTAPRGNHTLDAIWATRYLRSESGFGTRLQNRMLTRDAGLRGRTRVNSVLLRDTYTSPSFVNELSVHVLDFSNDQDLLAPGPTYQYQNIQIGRVNYPFAVRDLQLRFINKTSYHLSAAGQHALKAGVELSRVRTNAYRPLRNDGVFEFATDTSTLPGRASIGMGLFDPTSTRDAWGHIRGWLLGAYLQDQWQPVPSLTVTAGVRYDAEINTLNQNLITPWAEDTTLLRLVGEEFLNTGDREADLDNVAPRLAVAWDPFGSGRTRLRGGFGLMHDRVPEFGAAGEAIAVGWKIYTFSNPGTTDPDSLRRLVSAGRQPAPSNVVLLKDRLETPSSRQWSVGLGHQLFDRLALNLDYVHQTVRNAYVNVVTNRIPVQGGPRPLSSRWGDITLWDDFGDARFRAILASVTYEGRATRLTAAYTLGWAESEFGEFTTSDYPDSAAYVMQRSDTDERHRIVVSGFTRLPFGFDFSAMAIAASPRPVLASLGVDSNQNGSSLDDWPDGVRTLRLNGWDHWYRTVDLRLARAFPFASGRLNITVEVFDLLGWRNHSEYQATYSEPDYGQPIGDYARRQLQLGVRYQF